jgi:anti-sigma factor RsiW
MNCAEAKPYLSAYLDRELEFTLSIEVANHLQTCKACQSYLESLKLMSEKVQSQQTVFELPESLRLAVLPKTEVAFKRRPKPFLSGFATGIAASIIAVLLAIPVLRSQINGEAGSVVSMHLHSLQEGHLIDVVSSDHHVVKPWLAGKLNFTFDPENYEAEGFKLLGARMEYFEGEPAVALVYKRRDHIINLLVQKDVFKSELPLQSSSSGFHIRAWKNQDLRYLAISDISTSDLEQLQLLVLAHH